MTDKNLRDIEFFNSLGENELNDLKRISKVKEYSPGEIIFKEGAEGRDVYILMKGEVSIDKKISSGSRTVAILKKNEIFGEMALFENASRSATATAVSECEILEIDGKGFASFLAKKPVSGFAILMKIMSVTSSRLRNMDRYFTTLYEIARTMGSARSFREVAEIVARRTANSMSAEAVLFYSYDIYNDEFVCLAHSGTAFEVESVPGQSEIVSELRKRGYYRGSDVFSPGLWFISEISYEGKIEGFIAISSSSEFSWEDRILTDTICNMASPVIANLKIREEEELKKRLKDQKWTL